MTTPDNRNRRESWSFRYKPSAVLAAAEERTAYHANRRRWWEAACKKAEETLKKKGFEYREHESTLDTRIEIVGDPALASRVNECRRKIAAHRDLENRYATWMRALRARVRNQPKEELELSIGDIEFFGL